MRTSLLTLCIATSLPLCACFLSFTSVRAQTCTADFTYADSVSLVYFTSTSTGSIIFYAWNFGDGSFSNIPNPTHAYSNGGTYTVCLTVSEGILCTDSICKTITVVGAGGACTAEFSFAPDSINPLTFQFSDSSSSGTDSWTWDFGDFSPVSALANPIHTFPFTGVYNVCLTTTDSASCSDTHCELVDAGNLIPTCSALFVYLADSANTLKIHFYDISTNADTWEWKFGDGNYTSLQNPVHTYPISGNYDVCLIIKDTLTNCSDTTCLQVFAGTINTCDAGFTYNVTFTYWFQFTDTSTGNPTGWFWDFGDSITSTNQNPSHLYTADGVYDVCLTITDSTLTCNDYYCKTIQIGTCQNPCVADFTFSVSGNSAAFTNASTGDCTFNTWVFGDGSTDPSSDPIHVYDSAGSYQVCLRRSDVPFVGLCPADTMCKTVIIVPSSGTCQSDFSFTTTGTTVNFTDQSTGNPVSWFWDFGDPNPFNTTDTSTQQNPSYTLGLPITYNVCLTINNNSGCYSTACQQVNVVGTDTTCKAGFSSTVAGATVTFTDTSSSTNALFYTWNFGDGTTSNAANPVHTYDTSGTMQVCLFIQDIQASCYDTFCTSVTIVSSTGNCVGNFSYTVTGNTAGFTDLSTGNPVSWSWTFGDFLSTADTSSNPNPSYTYTLATTYTVCLTINDGAGCYNTYCAQVAVGTASCSAAFTTTTSGLTATFTNNSVAANTPTYSWTFDDGNISSAANPIHPYSNPGSYNVCLTVTDNQAACTDTYCDSITLTNIGFSENSVAMVNVSVIPNPFSVQAVITWATHGNSLNGVQLTISDLLGRDVTPPHIRVSDGFVVKRANLTTGMYFYELKNEKGVIAKGKLMSE